MKLKNMKFKRENVFFRGSSLLLPSELLKHKDAEGYYYFDWADEEKPLLFKWIKEHPESDHVALCDFVNALRRLCGTLHV